MKTFCTYCAPTPRTSHYSLHIRFYFEKVASPFSRLASEIFGPFFTIAHNAVWSLLLDLLIAFSLARVDYNPLAGAMPNRSRIFLQEAKQRGVRVGAIRIAGKYVNEFRFEYKGKRYYYEGIPLTIREAHSRIDDKQWFKSFLKKHKFPAPEGKMFVSANRAFFYGKNLGFPLVVKPANGSLSHHATYPIYTEDELKNAIAVAKIYRPDIIVEKFIAGSFYRATVIGKRRVYICRKDPANVIGDGVSTIKALIDQKNSHPLRASPSMRGATLHTISSGEALLNRLAQNGLSLSSILPCGVKLFFNNRVTLSSGADVITCTDSAHPKTRELFLEISCRLNTRLIGFDFICKDIELEFGVQEFAIIEANTLPYIDMHAYPSSGAPDPVARDVWDQVLESI
jgi:D-alanine-D-alanine ligase-like ATP-grasp enzyme